MIKIEFEEPHQERCKCCGNTSTRLTRFVYRDGDAYAVYYVAFTEGHEDRVAYALVGLGEWGEGGEPEDRTAFAVNIWDDNGSWAVTVTDRADSPWGHVTFLGNVLDREDALRHPWIKEVFHITDHIVAEDRQVVEFFA
ncbi:hypothetical protein [Pseudomonas sp. GD03944]|uniref:hypothetical protein n=1 Tax=Pseudomonas sp. GD03944 TaxID=2975409 RepID=UPI00244D6046|nr:hypothetical protein [Pseudomonas sp. GD03944]MDH1261977.1 hypothetical protein [Pseudomonas sp. GD03944]